MRKHYLDNGKALASFLGIVYHASLIFIASGWLITTPQTDHLPVLRIYTEYINLFRMPLFLFISGYFAAYAVYKYNLKDFTIRRLTRLGLPFVSTFLTFGLIEKIYVHRFNHEHLSALMTTMSPWSPGFNMSHLWFLYYVLMFSFMLYAGLTTGKRVSFNLFNRINLRGIHADVLLLGSMVGFFGFCGLLFIITGFNHGLFSFLTIGANLPFFVLGAVAFLKWDELKPRFFALSGARFVILSVLLIISYVLSDRLSAIIPNTDTLFDLFPRYFSLILVLGLLYRFLDKTNRILGYMAESSYSVYLLHHPVIVVIGYYYVKYVHLPIPALGYVLVLLASITVTYALDYLIIRNTRWGNILFTGAIRLKRKPDKAVPRALAE